MKKRGKDKRAQEVFGMSFGMIFSIILIIFFVVIAIIVIKSVMSSMECAKIGIFVKNLGSDVDRAWNSDGSTFESKGDVPSSIDYVCFADLGKTLSGNEEMQKMGDEFGRYNPEDNLFFYPTNKACNMPAHKVLHLNMSKITERGNPFCIKVNFGKVTMMIEKDSNENLVRISR